jgi:hypothetical protein
VDADHGQAGAGIALVPRLEVGERPDGVELRDIEEMDQDGPGGDEAVDRFDRFTDPLGVGR